MYNLRRFYNQNRKKIWRIVIIIASAILLLQLANYWYGHRETKQNADMQNVVSKSDMAEITSQKSTVSGERISGEKLNKETEIITTFAEKCTNQEIEEAYNMLTEECKEKQYPSLSDFKIYYGGIYFKEPRASFEIENWFGNIYKVNIVPDMLSTGRTNGNKVNQDYITVVKLNGEYKLNVNSYIGRTNVGESKEQDKIGVKVNYKDVYMDYEEYNITVKNNTNNKICLDTKEDVKTMYLEDRNDVQYPSITNEISENNLILEKGEEKIIDIKYYSRYSSTRIISRLVFSNVIMDYDRYENNGGSRETTISINI